MDLLDRIQKRVRKTVGPSFAASTVDSTFNIPTFPTVNVQPICPIYIYIYICHKSLKVKLQKY